MGLLIQFFTAVFTCWIHMKSFLTTIRFRSAKSIKLTNNFTIDFAIYVINSQRCDTNQIVCVDQDM